MSPSCPLAPIGSEKARAQPTNVVWRVPSPVGFSLGAAVAMSGVGLFSFLLNHVGGGGGEENFSV